MGLSEKDVEYVAKLARLELRDGERELYAKQLGAILQHAEDLAKLDTKDVAPTLHAVPLKNVFRPDVAQPSLPREQVLANAPDKAKGSFRVPKIIE